MPDTPTSDTRKLFDPGPMPDEPWRIFIPVLVGDMQTACTYLENACIRMESAGKQGEHFTARESRTADHLVDSMRETIDRLEDVLHTHREAWLDTA